MEAAAASRYEVIAVRYATRETTKADCYLRYHAHGEPDAPLRMDYFFWVLRNGDETVLVDTGFDPEVGRRRGRTCLCPPLEALERLGVAAGSVRRIVLTHLHYDHTGNVDAFPEAQLLLARRELDFWSSPQASRFQFAVLIEPEEIAGIVEAQARGRVRFLEDGETVLPGVSAYSVGGHSPGQLVLTVAGVRGTAVLASDAIHYYEELELDRPFDVVHDLEAMYRGYDLVRELSAEPGAILVAGHDPAVLDRFPPLEGEAAGLGVRVA
jgi:glyoxylase-like metal-dependent hydrolase (beta-lactamase superfamily II)